MKTKTCKVCGKIKKLILFRKNRRTCKLCLSVEQKKYQLENKDKLKAKREINKDKLKAYQNEYVKNNTDKRISTLKAYRDNNRSAINCKARIRHLIGRSNFSDSYVKQKIYRQCNIQYSQIPDELIELKRAQLKLYRAVK